MSIIVRPTRHLIRVYELLVQVYGKPMNEPDYDPLGGLIGTILSQHTSDTNSHRAYEQLIASFPTWEDVRDAPTNEIVDAIRCGGLAQMKSVRIQNVLCILTEQQQNNGEAKTLSEFLYDELACRSTNEALDYLCELPGVGPKTASCVLMFNLDRPAFPIDTHVHRVSKRLGLIEASVNADQAHKVFDKLVPPEWVYPLHVNLIRHGRQICHAQRPECDRCPLFNECAFVGNGDTSVSDYTTGIESKKPIC